MTTLSKEATPTVEKTFLIHEWNYEKNSTLNPMVITIGSKKRVWWLCEKGHEWEAVVYSRKTKGCPFCSGRRTTRENSLLTTHPSLAKQWHPTMNGNLTPSNVSSGSGRMAWWTCFDCKSDYKTIIANRARLGVGCGYCKGKKANHTNSLAEKNSFLASQWHPTRNNSLTINDITPTSGKSAWWLGECGHEWKAVISSRNSGNGCPICNGKKILIGFNDMWTTNPELASLLADPEDGYKYTQSSGKKVDWKCFSCNQINKNKTIGKVMEYGLCCNYCSDGFKYPEKFLINFLLQLDIEFTTQKEFDWLKNRKYDFYIPSHNTIIETHGGQHYIEQGYRSVGGRTLEIEQEIDTIKESNAKQNGIDKYIVLDCRKSTLAFIKDSIINSSLSKLFYLENIDWNRIAENSNSSKLVEACIFYTDNKDTLTIKEMSKFLKLDMSTFREYIKRGAEINLCDYKANSKVRKEVSNKNRVRSITQLSLDGVFIKSWKSGAEIKRSLNLNSSSIIGCCRGRGITAYGFKWMYSEDYNKKTE